MTKHADLWKVTRKEFLELNPPNHEGYYECHWCHKWVHYTEITVDHVIPRSRAPQLRYEHSNLVVCCGQCNIEKGSVIWDVRTFPQATIEEIPWHY